MTRIIRRTKQMLTGKIINSTRGTTAVEFAIIMPLLFVLIFGIIEFAVVLYNQAVITNAGREAARFAATFYVNPATAAKERAQCSDVQNYVVQYVYAHIIDFTSTTPFGASNVSCCTSNVSCSTAATPYNNYGVAYPSPGYVDIIRIEYQYGFLVFGNLIGLLDRSGSSPPWSSVMLRTQTQMRDENQG